MQFESHCTCFIVDKINHQNSQRKLEFQPDTLSCKNNFDALLPESPYPSEKLSVNNIWTKNRLEDGIVQIYFDSHAYSLLCKNHIKQYKRLLRQIKSFNPTIVEN